MAESPLIRKLVAERSQELILEFLTGRFGGVPPDLEAHVRAITKEKRLKEIAKQAAQCPDLETFRAFLLSS